MLRTLAVIGIAAALGGCGVFQKAQSTFRVDPVIQYPQTPGGFFERGSYVPINLEKFTLEGDKLPAYELAAGSPAKRDALQLRIMNLSDHMCEQHLGDAQAAAQLGSAGFGIVANVLTTAAAAVTGGAPQTALSAAGAMTGATRSELDQHIYQRQFVGALVDVVQKSRLEKKTEIMANQGKPVDAYGVERAIHDALDYHNRCSFYHGVNLIRQVLDKPKVSRDDLVRRATLLADEIRRVEGLKVSAAGTDRAKLYDAMVTGLANQLSEVYKELSITK